MPKSKKSSTHIGAFATNTQVGAMLGMRTGQGDVFDKLLEAQKRKARIDAVAIEEIADQTETGEARVRGVASFYSLLNTDSSKQSTIPVLRVCDGPSCGLCGGDALLRRCREIANDTFRIERTSCVGYCEQAPSMLVDEPNGQFRFVSADPTKILDLAELPPADSAREPQLLGHPSSDISRRPLTARFNVVDPHSIDDALSAGAYLALTRSLETDRCEIINTIEASGLRGRGGAGFKTGQKWRIAADTKAGHRYVICNADESEPGTFKDRMLMENDPHLLLEGMAICARAIGANEGIIYIRGEYSDAANVLEHAIHQSREKGYLGENIQGSGFHFDISLHRGAGAYICGEETALLESLEGRRGEPRQRPPFPATDGFRGRPTVVNNVETLCSVPSIIRDGPDHYRDLGRGNANGTKLFCLSGHVARPGICEAPMGTPLGQVIDEFGGGMREGSELKFALTGGAAGTFVPASLTDIPLAFDSWSKRVAIGSGAIIVADETVSAAEMLLSVLNCFAYESCGKCTPCRIGTVQAREIVQGLVSGRGKAGDVEELLEIAKTLGATSFCALGQSVAWPIESAVHHFRADFD